MEYINIKNGYTKEDVVKISEIIKKGEVVILPTDTVYGLAADALNIDAVKKVYELKQRELSKPMSILVSNMDMILKVTKDMSVKEERIIENFFPGALTMVLKRNNMIPDIVTANLDTIGIRMPRNKFLLEVIDCIGMPIIATSCNLSGKSAMTDVQEILSEFKDKVSAIVDEGKSEIGVTSTIIKIEENTINVLRKGPIDKKDIIKKLTNTCDSKKG